MSITSHLQHAKLTCFSRWSKKAYVSSVVHCESSLELIIGTVLYGFLFRLSFKRLIVLWILSVLLGLMGTGMLFVKNNKIFPEKQSVVIYALQSSEECRVAPGLWPTQENQRLRTGFSVQVHLRDKWRDRAHVPIWKSHPVLPVGWLRTFTDKECWLGQPPWLYEEGCLVCPQMQTSHNAGSKSQHVQ